MVDNGFLMTVIKSMEADDYLSPTRILPPHEVRDKNKFQALVKAFFLEGWQGRPLLVEPAPDDGPAWAWTGSHRLAAAKAAHLEEIPVVYVDTEKLEAEGYLRGQKGYFVELLFDDYEKERALRSSDDTKALELIEIELQKNLEDELVVDTTGEK